MTTLLRVGNSEGERRCDAKCYVAAGKVCRCICAGMNHGAGLDRAQNNTAALAEHWIEEYNARNPEHAVSLYAAAGAQLRMEIGA